MRQVNSWQNLCACGAPKNRYAQECVACHRANRRDTCRCGKPKYKTKPLCRDCTHTRDFCACGNTKHKRAKICTLCRQIEPAEKRCRGCNEKFPIGDFALRPDGKGGHKRRSRCRLCEAREQQDRHANDPEKYKQLKKESHERTRERRRIDPEYDQAFRLQIWKRYWSKRGYDVQALLNYMEYREWRCEICGTTLTFSTKAVDHDHATGQFRGLLCSQCNAALGLFKDNIAALQGAIAYLQKTSIELAMFANNSKETQS